MAEEITKYVTEVDFDGSKALRKLATYEKKMKDFTKRQAKMGGFQGGMLDRKGKGLPIRQPTGVPQPITTPKAVLPKTQSPPKVSGPDKNNAHLKAREKHLLGIQRAAEQEAKAFAKAKIALKESNAIMSLFANKNEKARIAATKTAIANAKTAAEIRKIGRDTKAWARDMAKVERRAKKTNFLMNRMQDSSKHIAGNMVSAFAAAAAVTSITRIGQQFEGVESGLLAVSGTAKAAAEDLAFVREESFRLGKPLKESASAFMGMLAAKGNLEKDQVKGIFTGMQEAATVLGLTADEANRANISISQMMSKTLLM